MSTEKGYNQKKMQSELVRNLAQRKDEIKQRCFADLSGESKRDRLGIVPEGTFDEVVCFSDIHADMGVVVTILQDMNLIRIVNGELEWAAKPGVRWAIVINGDIVDRLRGPRTNRAGEGEFRGEEHLILVFLNAVDLLARKHQSRLFKMVGNHEVMNMKGHFQNVSQYGIESFGSPEGRQRAFEIGGEMNAHLRACGAYAMLKIGSLLFVHAGVMPSLIRKVQEMRNGKRDFVPFSNEILNQMLETPPSQWATLEPWVSLLFLSPDSLLWTRHLSSIDAIHGEGDGEDRSSGPSGPPGAVGSGAKGRLSAKQIQDIFSALGWEEEAHRMTLIVGHTPQIYRCFAQLTNRDGPRVECASTGYSLRQPTFTKNPKIEVLGGPFIKDNKSFHTITFACLSTMEGVTIPQLCFVDTAQSRAFNNPSMDKLRDQTGRLLEDVRRPTALSIKLRQGKLPQFFVVTSKLGIKPLASAQDESRVR